MYYVEMTPALHGYRGTRRFSISSTFTTSGVVYMAHHMVGKLGYCVAIETEYSYMLPYTTY